jgi:predicted AlkP superfamily phosphohydrolase/phosphomutase
MTYPAEEVNGYLLGGFEAPAVNNRYAWPRGIKQEIKDATGKDFDLHGDFWTRESAEYYFEKILETMENQAQSVKYLIGHHPADFFMYVFGATDRVQHYFWKYQDKSHPLFEESQFRYAIEKVYMTADRITGELLDLIPDPKTVIVMSDHGFGPLKKIVHLDKWLEQEGYLAWKQKRLNKRQALIKRIYMDMRLYLPQYVKDRIKSLFPNFRSNVESNLILGGIDWKKTKAFTVGVESTAVFINRKDRFPMGQVVYKSKEYYDLIDKITCGIKQIVDPETGKQIAEKVWVNDQVYHGPEVVNAPDLFVTWLNHEYVSRRHYRDTHDKIVSSKLKSGVMGKLMTLENTGCHRPEGIFMASGPGIKKNYSFESASIVDVFPLVLHCMGLDPIAGIDGKIPGHIFETYIPSKQTLSSLHSTQAAPDNEIKNPEMEYHLEDHLEDHEEEVIYQRLKDLGYME